jgi:chemotaxis protein MotA
MKKQQHGGISVGRLDLTVLLGLMVAVGGILAGVLMEGGRLADVSQITAAVIVFGGTAGAVMLTVPQSTLASALHRARSTLYEEPGDSFNAVDAFIRYAKIARRQGVGRLEEELPNIADPFLRKALMLAIDGVKPEQIRDIMSLEIKVEAERAEEDASVFECAGGYAPTIGIIGAVIGLIQVMKHLNNTSEVGAGIAVAFVATVYGVGSANLLFLPLGQKIRLRCQRFLRARETTLEGVVGIAEQLHPRLLRDKLESSAELEQPLGEYPVKPVEAELQAVSA